MSIVTPVRVASVGTLAVAGFSAMLSFTALSDLAAQNAVPAGEAFAIPLIVDGGAIVATAATLALSKHRRFAWALLVLSSMASVVGNVVHALPHGIVAAVIAAIPPLWLLAMTHLTVMLVRQHAKEAPETLHVVEDVETNLLEAA
ncbi:excisionase [Mycobacterium phage Anthony]|uniref:Uncharacterized protein n=1 Tax=Mycobacterium phage Anthony TaxID=2599857 RepID=A0A5J6TI62_9CAUD|nr:excisionase [Mycobacterium phage Anthony]QFG10405.1 hypothetical protein PBI_ANTHONY_34 [Mycobacterium phage Anthony]